jgi:hypothetical protein
MKENWKVVEDGTLSSIEKTDEEVDDYCVFSSFTKAKKNLIENLKDQVNQYKNAIKIAREMKASEIKHRKEIYE